MAIADLKNVLKVFSGSAVDEGRQKDLFEETMLMTLARGQVVYDSLGVS